MMNSYSIDVRAERGRVEREANVDNVDDDDAAAVRIVGVKRRFGKGPQVIYFQKNKSTKWKSKQR